MATGAAPNALNSRHMLVATLEAAGRSDVEIGEMVGMHPNRISIVRKSPLYQALLVTERRRMAERLRESETDRVLELAETAWDTKREMIEQRDNLAVANAAADSIIDRLVPKKTEREERREVVVKLTVEHEALIKRTLEEDPEPPRGLTPLAAATLEVIAAEDDESDEAEANA